MGKRATKTHGHIAGPLVALGSAALALGLGALGYALQIEPHWLDIKPVSLRLKRLAPEFDGYRIAHFSDLHMEKWRNWELLDRVIDAANAFEPDLVVITGDLVHSDGGDICDQLSEHLARLRPSQAALAILGNHDHYVDANAVRRLIARAGMVNVSNEVYTIRRGDAALHIAGLDSIAEYAGRFDRVLDCVPKDSGAAILLAHEPDIAYVVAPTGRFDVQLSGHSHGGQIHIPLLEKLALPRFGRSFVRGLYFVEGMYVYTNRGLGYSALPLRFNSRPELTLFTLHSASA